MQTPYTYYLFLFPVILNRAYHTHTDNEGRKPYKSEIFENHYIQTELIVRSNINDHEKFSINLGFIKTSRLPLIIFSPYQQS